MGEEISSPQELQEQNMITDIHMEGATEPGPDGSLVVLEAQDTPSSEQHSVQTSQRSQVVSTWPRTYVLPKLLDTLCEL